MYIRDKDHEYTLIAIVGISVYWNIGSYELLSQYETAIPTLGTYYPYNLIQHSQIINKPAIFGQ